MFICSSITLVNKIRSNQERAKRPHPDEASRAPILLLPAKP